jgi:hypothetical protein
VLLVERGPVPNKPSPCTRNWPAASSTRHSLRQQSRWRPASGSVALGREKAAPVSTCKKRGSSLPSLSSIRRRERARFCGAAVTMKVGCDAGWSAEALSHAAEPHHDLRGDRSSSSGTQKQCRRRCSAGAPPAHRPRALDARRTNRHSRQRCAALLSNLASGPSYKLRVREFAGIPISRNRICSLSANSCSRCASAMTPALRASGIWRSKNAVLARSRRGRWQTLLTGRLRSKCNDFLRGT